MDEGIDQYLRITVWKSVCRPAIVIFSWEANPLLSVDEAMRMGKLKAWAILLCVVGSLLAPGLLPAQEDAVVDQRAVEKLRRVLVYSRAVRIGYRGDGPDLG